MKKQEKKYNVSIGHVKKLVLTLSYEIKCCDTFPRRKFLLHKNIAIWWLISSRESLMHYFLFFNVTTARLECQFLWNKTVFHFSEFFLFHNMESSIELACLSSFWWHDTFIIDLTRKLKAQAKLNFAKCLSHPSCLLISSAISFSFSCLIFSLQLTVLQVNVLLYTLSHSNFS